MLKNKKILLAITGSIAAYKAAVLVRLLVKAGAEVKVVMTRSATEFITPLTLATLSKQEVLTDLSDAAGNWANHVMLGRESDLMLIAPASCNSIAKLAQGQCNNLLQAIYLSATCPVVISPAMDEDMWKHPATKRNLKQLQEDGVSVIPVNHGELASGLIGEGRMAEPEEIIKYLTDHFENSGLKGGMSGRKVLITAGPTMEALDPVRYISNHSSGKMGLALAKAAQSRGAEVVLVLGPVNIPAPENIEVINVQSAQQMYDACHAQFSTCDIAILAAAVADYTPANVSDIKIKKAGEDMNLALVKTKDILKSLGEIKAPKQVLVGFALETNNEKENALKKLKSKNADFIVLNSMQDKGAGFGHDTNKVSIFDKSGTEKSFNTKSKDEVAADILDTIMAHA